MTAVLTRHKLSVSDFHQMAEARILAEDDHLELIEGDLIDMMPIGQKHAAMVNRLTYYFSAIFGDRATLTIQNPLVLGDRTEVYPDVLLLERRADFYAFGHPVPADVYLVVEVADSSLNYDRSVKFPLYAEAKIPEVWLVNLADDRLEIYHQPMEKSYQHVLILQRGDALRLLAFPEVELDVIDLIGPTSG